MAKSKFGSAELQDMEQEKLESFSPDNSPGMRARLDAMRKHPRGRALNELGQEMPDPTPVAPPIGYNPSPSLREQIRDMIRSEAVRFYADQEGYDTFEEADDFEVGDEDERDPSSPYEQEFDPLPPGELTRRRQAEYVKERQSEENPEPQPRRPGPDRDFSVPEAADTPKPEVGGAGGTPPAEAAQRRS